MDAKDWEKSWRFSNMVTSAFVPIEILARLAVRNGMQRLLNNLHVQKPSILELGAGTGLDSEWLVRKFGGKALLVDNCDYIIRKSKKYFRGKKLGIAFLKSNVEDIKFKKGYDLVYSVGLLEHFYDKDLHQIFRRHMDASKKTGYVMVFVPNDKWVYNFYRRILTILGSWVWDEKPFNLQRLKKLGKVSNSNLLKTTEIFFGMWIGALYKKA